MILPHYHTYQLLVMQQYILADTHIHYRCNNTDIWYLYYINILSGFSDNWEKEVSLKYRYNRTTGLQNVGGDGGPPPTRKILNPPHQAIASVADVVDFFSLCSYICSFVVYLPIYYSFDYRVFIYWLHFHLTLI